jgi:predicted Fe-Mo cluster-binding NifX family protein
LEKSVLLSELEILKSNLSMEIKKKFPQIFKIIILTKPQEKRIVKIATPVEDDNGSKSIIFDHYGESPYFALITFEEGEVISLEIQANQFLKEEKRKGILISDWLNTEKIDKIYLKNELKKGPYLILKTNLVQMEITQFETIEQIIENEMQLFLS